jgi:hypothetical protein
MLTVTIDSDERVHPGKILSSGTLLALAQQTLS